MNKKYFKTLLSGLIQEKGMQVLISVDDKLHDSKSLQSV